MKQSRPVPLSTERGSRRESKRAHLPSPTRERARRGRETAAASLDIDQLYLSEMARSTLLTAETELAIANRIEASERDIVAAIVKSHAGREALVRLGARIREGSVDMRDLLLNPDQAGLDLDQVRVAVATAMLGSPDAVPALASARLSAPIVDELVRAVEGAPHSTRSSRSTFDAKCMRAIVIARRLLDGAKKELVVGNLRLVVLFARKYRHRGVPLLDLVQEGNLGLMRAAEKFDHRRGFRFSTYAAWWIKQALQRALLDRTMRLPVHVADDRRRIGKVRALYMTQQRREPTTAEIATSTGLGHDRIETILSLPLPPSSLDAPIGEDGESSLGDFVPGEAPSPDEATAAHALGGQLDELIGTLNPREQEVLRLRFGIGGHERPREHTLEEVGRLLSLTRERIRQIERAALDKLRARSERVELASYLER